MGHMVGKKNEVWPISKVLSGKFLGFSELQVLLSINLEFSWVMTFRSLMEKHFQILLEIGYMDDDFGKLVIWY